MDEITFLDGQYLDSILLPLQASPPPSELVCPLNIHLLDTALEFPDRIRSREIDRHG